MRKRMLVTVGKSWVKVRVEVLPWGRTIHHTAGLVLACGAAQIGFGDQRVDIRMDHRASARRRCIIGAGAADQGPLSNLSRNRGRADRLCAVEPVLDAGARPGTGSLCRTGPA